ncbi:MAG TPA: Rieske 2Fe-2S domain-containing protein, partial [Pseudonocardia sp.]|nr:Rieske 2Fe-2S domain-containing protein [Pseudonocardia sp.]
LPQLVPDVPMYIPHFPSPAVRTKLAAAGPNPVVEVPQWEEVETAPGVRLFSVSEPPILDPAIAHHNAETDDGIFPDHLWPRFAEYFTELLQLSGYLNSRIDMRVGFEIDGPGGGAWAVDFRPGQKGALDDMIEIVHEGMSYRVRRRCPHTGDDLLDTRELRPGGLLRCLAHHHDFDLATGACVTGECEPFQVEVLDGRAGERW